MGLASQSARSGSRRAYMSSRRKRRRPIWLWLVMIAVVAAVGWWWMGSGESDADSQGGPEVAVNEPAPIEPEIRFDQVPDRSETNRATPTPPRATRPTPPTPTTTTTSTKTGSDTTTSGSAAVADQRPVDVPATAPASTASPARPAPRTTQPTSKATALLQEANDLADRDPIAAREKLTLAWLAGLSDPHRWTAITLSRRLADSTLLDVPDESGSIDSPYLRSHIVQPGEVLSRIIRQQDLQVNVYFITDINGLQNANTLKQGDTLLLPEGRFTAVVYRRFKELAVFQELDGRRDLLLVMPVGIGVDGRTPVGMFRVKSGSKTKNPSWRDPVTGRLWKSNDEDNPIGDYWIGLESIDEADRANPAHVGLGLHGTLEENTVGTECTNGSIRLRNADIELLFGILASGKSTVAIED